MTAPPHVGRTRPSSIRSVVDLPAPFGPRKPVTAPARTSKLRSSTATTSPKRLLSPWISIAAICRSPWRFRCRELSPAPAGISSAGGPVLDRSRGRARLYRTADARGRSLGYGHPDGPAGAAHNGDAAPPSDGVRRGAGGDPGPGGAGLALRDVRADAAGPPVPPARQAAARARDAGRDRAAHVAPAVPARRRPARDRPPRRGPRGARPGRPVPYRVGVIRDGVGVLARALQRRGASWRHAPGSARAHPARAAAVRGDRPRGVRPRPRRSLPRTAAQPGVRGRLQRTLPRLAARPRRHRPLAARTRA